MKRVLALLACVFAGILAVLPPVAANGADTPAVAVVRQFLEARARGQGNKMQALLSQATPLLPGQKGYTNTEVFSGLTPVQAAVLSLLHDPNNNLGFKFSLLDADPEFPNIIRVRADPATGPSLTLQVVVEPDASAADSLRVDELLTLNCADPRIMLPIVERLRSYANQSLSQQHLHQLSLAAIQYEQDNDEKMPDAAHWVDELMPYLAKDLTLFHDPSTPPSQKWGYSYNSNLSGNGIVQVVDPAKTVMFFESTAGVKNASDTGQSVPRPGRDQGSTDYAFADGHVKPFPDGTKLSYRMDGK